MANIDFEAWKLINARIDGAAVALNAAIMEAHRAGIDVDVNVMDVQAVGRNTYPLVVIKSSVALERVVQTHPMGG